jgi:metallo-beta-lactamase family protein
MAVNATDVYRKFANEDNLDEDVVDRLNPVTGRIYPKHVQFHRTTDESKALNEMRGPRIIVSSSGMLAGGRVLHHLRRILPERKNLLILVGYQARGTRGRALLDGKDYLKMHGRRIPAKCRFISAHGLSAHADRDEMVRWIGTAPAAPKKIFVVHGEPESSEAFATTLREEFGSEVIVPALDESFGV